MGRGGAYKGLVGTLSERGHLEDSGIDGRIILRWILRTLNGRALSGFDLTQDRKRRRALLNIVMNLRIPENVGNFLTN